jgi:hypothetical protein
MFLEHHSGMAMPALTDERLLITHDFRSWTFVGPTKVILA